MSHLEAVLKDALPVMEKGFTHSSANLKVKPDIPGISTLIPPSPQRNTRQLGTVKGLQRNGRRKEARALIEPSVKPGARVSVCIIDGKLQLARRLPRALPGGRRAGAGGKALPDRIEQILFDPGATRAVLETMLSEWGESTINIDDTLVRHVTYFLKCFTLCEREGTIATLERSRKYLPQIIRAFAKHRLPEDLAFAVPFVESRFSETARSSAGAVGMFQFLAPTARDYGVAVDCDMPGHGNSKLDERLDWNKASLAAAQYLTEHRKMFNSVLLALGAYHHGATTVAKVVSDISREGKEKSFHRIFACRELEAYSREYIPLCLAAACLHRLAKQNPASSMPNLTVQYVSIKKPAPLKKLSAQHGDLTTNNPDLALADQLYCYASTGGYLLITELSTPALKRASSQLPALRIAKGKL